MPRLQEFLDKMLTWAKQTEGKRKAEFPPEEVADYLTAKYQFGNGFNAFVGNLFEREGFDNAVIKMQLFVPETERTNLARFMAASVRLLLHHHFGVPNDFIPENTTALAKDDAIALLREARERVDDKKKFDSDFSILISNNLAAVYKQFDEPGSFESFLGQLRSGFAELPEDCVPDEKTYLSATQIGDKADLHPFAGEIDALKEEYKNDPAAVEALEDANRILIQGDRPHVAHTSNIAESLGVSVDKVKFNNILANIAADPDLGKHKFSPGRTHVEVPDDISPEERAEVIDVLLKRQIPLKEEEKQAVKDIIRLTREAGIFNPETFESESDFKIYSMSALVRAQKEVAEAVKKKDLPAILSAREKYVKLEAAYDDLIRRCHEVNPSLAMVSNISSSREVEVPAKYRLDAVGVSRLTGVWMFLGLCNRVGVSPEEIVDNPTEGIRKVTELALSTGSHTLNYIKNTDLAEVLNEFSEGTTGALKTASEADDLTLHAFERGFGGMAILFPDSAAHKALDTSMMLLNSAYVGDGMMEQSMRTTYFASDRAEKISRLFFVDPKDRDIFALDPKPMKVFIDPVTRQPRVPFDKAAYLASGKTTGAEIVVRALNTLRDLNEKYPACKLRKDAEKALVKTARALRGMNVSPTVKNVCKALVKGGRDAIKRTDLVNLEAEAKFAGTVRGGILPANVADAIRQIGDLKRGYDQRSVFAKIFYSSVRNQSALIKSMKNDLVANGVNRDSLNRALDAGSADNKAGYEMAVSEITSSLVAAQAPANVDDFEIVQQVDVPEAQDPAPEPEPNPDPNLPAPEDKLELK